MQKSKSSLNYKSTVEYFVYFLQNSMNKSHVPSNCVIFYIQIYLNWVTPPPTSVYI